MNLVRSAYLQSLWSGSVKWRQEFLSNAPVDLFGREQREWLRQMVQGPAEVHLSHDAFMEGQKEVRDRLLARSEVWLACSPADPWFVMGFIVAERTNSALVLHFVYVKQHFRRLGLGLRLIESMAEGRRRIVATHRTRGWDQVAPRLTQRGFAAEFNPYPAILSL